MSANAAAQKTAVRRGRSRARDLVHKKENKKPVKVMTAMYTKENV